MDRASPRWPLPKSTIEWVIVTPFMVFGCGLVALATGTGTMWRWGGFAVFAAFFTWLADLTNRRFTSLRTRGRYLVFVGIDVGLALGLLLLPFSR